MRNNSLAILIDITVISLSTAFLWHFSNIWRLGSHFIKEPNRFILIIETLMFLGILIFGVIRLVKDLKGISRND